MRHREVRLWGALAFLAVVSACGQPPAAGSPGPADSAELWPDGDYELEADIAYRSEGPTGAATRRVKHKAVLTVGPGDELQLMSTVGLCRLDPRDRRPRSRRFLCGEATYDLEPSGGIVAGTVSVRAEVMVRGPRRCVQYQTSPDGTRTCVRYDAPLETRWTTLTERLRVKRLDGGAT